MKSASIFGLRSCFLFISCCFHIARANNGSSSVEVALQKITENYNEKLRPNFEGAPVKIIASAYIVAVDNVNDVNSDFTVKMYFTQKWNDSRLAYGRKLGGAVKLKTIRTTGKFVEEIWTPDTYVENEEGTGSHNEFSGVKITNMGIVQLSQRLNIKADCPTMDLKLFPHDVQHCSLLMTSYAYPNDELTYDWRSTDAIVVGESPITSPFKLLETSANIENQFFKSANASWTYMKMTFILKRKIAYYVIRIYLPAILVTITSWISFWVDPTAIPARLSLCVITVLAMTTLSYSSQSMVPSVPYVKAVDVYLIISFFFVFGSLLEYAILLNLSNLQSNNKNEDETEMISLKAGETNGQHNEVAVDYLQQQVCASEKKGVFSSCSLDCISMVLFPSAYVMFHLVFFVVILG